MQIEINKEHQEYIDKQSKKYLEILGSLGGDQDFRAIEKSYQNVISDLESVCDKIFHRDTTIQSVREELGPEKVLKSETAIQELKNLSQDTIDFIFTFYTKLEAVSFLDILRKKKSQSFFSIYKPDTALVMKIEILIQNVLSRIATLKNDTETLLSIIKEHDPEYTPNVKRFFYHSVRGYETFWEDFDKNTGVFANLK